MLKFVSAEFETELKECLRYIVDEFPHGLREFRIDLFDILDDDFNPSDYDDVCLDDDYETTLDLDYSDEEIDVTLRELINIIDETKTAVLEDNRVCTSSRRCLLRVAPENYEDVATIDILFTEYGSPILSTTANFDGIDITCSLSKGLTIFGIMVHKSNDYDKYYPSVTNEDLFVEITFENIINKDGLVSIFESYTFELDGTLGIKLCRSPRPSYLDDYIDNAEVLTRQYTLRPLLFGNGICELLSLFNESRGNNNLDISIIQYVKVIEYVSQTVIRHDITNRLQCKLFSPRALNPDANFIKDIENTFDDLKQKYSTDRDAIKNTIKTCCDISEIIDYAPDYLSKIKRLPENMSKDKVQKEGVLDAAYDNLANSISDTRNAIAHAKANYILKGNECPEDQKYDFVEMLRVLAIQTIRWFSRIHEDQRITSG